MSALSSDAHFSCGILPTLLPVFSSHAALELENLVLRPQKWPATRMIEGRADRDQSDRRPRVIVLDLSAVEMLDGGGLGMLVLLHCWTRDNGIQLKLVNPFNFVREMREQTGLTSFLHVSSLDDAVEGLCNFHSSNENVNRPVLSVNVSSHPVLGSQHRQTSALRDSESMVGASHPTETGRRLIQTQLKASSAGPGVVELLKGLVWSEYGTGKSQGDLKL